jgi:2,3-bisphosphoglycerate-dependent phosphoglycerate mutase
MVQLILLRHGWSQWNEENRFTGWVDVDLHSSGVHEAMQAGEILREHQLHFDVVFTSVQKRAIRTTSLCMHSLAHASVPVHQCWELNERHYGALQGLNKAETAVRYGAQQVLEWRRGYAIRPPALTEAERLRQASEPAYRSVPMDALPGTESLADTLARVVPWFERVVLPLIREGKRVLISAHGNSLRALVKYLDNVPDEAIVKLTLPTAIPLLYELDGNAKALSHRYLGDPEVVAKRIAQAEYAMYHVDGKRGP